MTRIKFPAATTTFFLVAILLVAAFLRLWQLDHADVVTDEAFLGTRAIGYLDFLGTQAQGTPSEWYNVRPWWSYLSFHDHPPLNFLVQHFSMRVLGENAWGLRFPSALAGIATVWLLYLIGRKLRDEVTGLVAASLGAVELYLVWPSRLGLQESLTLALLLTAFYLFLKALDDPRWWYAVWTVYALSILSKYTVIVYLPVVFTYLIIAHRQTFRSKAFWISQNMQGIITLPLLIYNIALFRDRGHFDVQLSTLLGMDVPEWRNLPGKNIGTLAERVNNFLPLLEKTAAPLLLILAGLSLLYLLWRWRAARAKLVLLGVLWTSLLLLVVGPAPRFFVLLMPWLLVAVALVGREMYQRLPKFTAPFLLLALFATLGYHGWYAWVNTFSPNYASASSWTFSLLRRESGAYGYQQLEAVLAREVDAFRPLAPAQVQYPILQQVVNQGYARDSGKPVKPMLIAFDADLVWPTPLWYFIRRTLYHGWTAISTDGLKTALEEGQFSALAPDATSTQVLLVVGEHTLERAPYRTESAEWFVEQLQLASTTPTAVVGDLVAPYFTLWTVPAEKFEAVGRSQGSTAAQE